MPYVSRNIGSGAGVRLVPDCVVVFKTSSHCISQPAGMKVFNYKIHRLACSYCIRYALLSLVRFLSVLRFVFYFLKHAPQVFSSVTPSSICFTPLCVVIAYRFCIPSARRLSSKFANSRSGAFRDMRKGHRKYLSGFRNPSGIDPRLSCPAAVTRNLLS